MAVPQDWSPELVEAVDMERVRLTLYAAVVCESIPRRLGRDASASELAIDKRLARRVANAYRTLWMSLARMGGPDAPSWSSRAARLELAGEAEPEARRLGATVRWGEFFAARRELISERRRLVAAYALDAQLPKWGGRRVGLLNDELSNLDRIQEWMDGRKT